MSHFAAQLAANDREHVERLEAIVRDLWALAVTSGEERIQRAMWRHLQAIRDELVRWKRPHPMDRDEGSES
jgi:hypothetical protein